MHCGLISGQYPSTFAQVLAPYWNFEYTPVGGSIGQGLATEAAGLRLNQLPCSDYICHTCAISSHIPLSITQCWFDVFFFFFANR